MLRELCKNSKKIPIFKKSLFSQNFWLETTPIPKFLSYYDLKI